MLSDLTSGSNMNGWIPNFLRLSALSRERQVPLITQSGKALFSELTRARPEYPSPKMKTWEGVTSALWIWVENFSLLASVVRFVDAIWIKSSKVMLAGQNASHGIILIVDVKRADREIIFVDSDCKHIWLACSVDSSHFNHLTSITYVRYSMCTCACKYLLIKESSWFVVSTSRCVKFWERINEHEEPSFLEPWSNPWK